MYAHHAFRFSIEDADPAMFEIAAFDCNDDDLNEFLKEERRFH